MNIPAASSDLRFAAETFPVSLSLGNVLFFRVFTSVSQSLFSCTTFPTESMFPCTIIPSFMLTFMFYQIDTLHVIPMQSIICRFQFAPTVGEKLFKESVQTRGFRPVPPVVLFLMSSALYLQHASNSSSPPSAPLRPPLTSPSCPDCFRPSSSPGLFETLSRIL